MSTTGSEQKQKYFTRFNEIYEDPYEIFKNYLSGNISLSDIGQNCKKGRINQEFRPTVYKILLGILPYDKPGSWKKLVQKQRETYYTKLNKLLSQNENIIRFINCHYIKGSKPYEEIYSLLPKDQKEIISLIKLDIDRTFQDLDLFHNNTVKELLTKILYVNSIDNPDPSYCQGMNEILGTLFFAFLPSLRYNKFNKDQNARENNDKVTNIEMLYYFIVDDEHFEADLYTVYSELMSRDLTLLYTYNDDRYRNKNNQVTYDLQNITEEDLIKSEESDLLKRIKNIFYRLLKKIDSKYFEFLFGNIEPNLFLLRWLLCMLDREISLKNVLWVWDCIFFYEFVEFTFEKKNIKEKTEKETKRHITRLNFLDFVCLSMILDLKRDIIHTDSSVALCKFLKFPNEKNIKKIMKEAFKLSETLNGGIDKWENEQIKKAKNLIE
jgi:hypothetical protein